MHKEKVYNDLSQLIDKNKILIDEPMKNHTTFKIGGKADFLIKAEEKEDIALVYKYAIKNNIPVYIIGRASNLLVKDNGIRGIVIKNLYDNIKILNQNEEEVELEISSGTTCTKAAKFALEYSLEGLEFSYGIPGTIGGAVRMNAGAYGGEIKNCVEKSLVLDKEGNEKILDYNDHNFVYRNSSIANNNYILLSTKIKLKRGNKEEIQQKMEKNMKARLEKQPYNMPSAGSVFKRGNGFITAQIIDEAGLRGKEIGGAQISPKHAGFIVNNGTATAEDVINLIDYVKKTVKEKFNKELETEVIIIGE